MVGIAVAKPNAAPTDLPPLSQAEKRADYEGRMSEIERICANDPDAPGLHELVSAFERMAYPEEVAGAPMTREFLGDYRFDEDDQHSRDARIRKYDEALYSHIWHRKNRPPRSRHGNTLVYGGMGEGKSAGVNHDTLRLFMRGWTVCHNLGFFYGNLLEGKELMSFAANCPRYCNVVADELQDQISTMASNTIALRLFSTAGGAMLRRNRTILTSMTAARWLIPDAFLASLNAAIKSRKWRPKSGRYVAPPWAYIYQRKVEPRPFRPKDNFEKQHGIEDVDEQPVTYYRSLHPYKVWDSSLLYDSFADVTIGESVRNTADVMRVMVGAAPGAKDRAEGAMEGIFRVMQSDWMPDEDKFSWQQLYLEAQLTGMDGAVTVNEFGSQLFRLVTPDYAKRVSYESLANAVARMLARFQDDDDDFDEPIDEDEMFGLVPVDDEGWSIEA